MKKVFVRIHLILGLAAMAFSSLTLPAKAQSSIHTASVSAPTQLDVSNHADGVSIVWDVANSSGQGIEAASINAAVNSLTTMRFGGYDLPMQLQTVLLPDGVAAETKVEQIASMPWRTALRVSEPLSPNVLEGEDDFEPIVEPMQFPDKPLFVLREGRVRGQRVAVVAFSPIYESNGEVKMAHAMQAKVPNGESINGGLGALMERVSSPKALRAVSGSAAPTLYEPTNPAAAQNAVQITVTNLGIQELSGADLSNAGIGTGTPLSQLQVSYQGDEIPLHIQDVAGNGVLDTGDTIRFYAMPKEHSQIAGDYWNSFDTFWLTASAPAGATAKRMLSRSVVPPSPSSAAIRTTGMESGIWEENSKAESTMPGVDKDYWFAGSLNSDSSMLGDPTLYPSVNIQLNNRLPLATNSMLSKFELTGAARTVTTHKLDVAIGGTTEQLSWSNLQYFENWSEVITTTAHSSNLKLTLRPGVDKSSIRYDKIYWEQPVELNFTGGGAEFSGIPGIWRYNLSNVPSSATLYDISNPMVPVVLNTSGGINVLMEDGPVAKKYILAANNTLHKPAVTTHSPVIFNANDGADTLYIAPAHFHDELQPLVAHRQAQGYKVKVVDVEDIYDAWSFGQSSPESIRNFMQFAVNNWSPAPIAAVLVGDTTADPRNYYGNMNGEQNKNLVPAFISHVDPWIGRTACEVCMAQLDGDDPLLSSEDPDILIDIWLGRFSAQTETDVSDIVDKILTYETSVDLNNPSSWVSPDSAWRGRSVYISEEYVSRKCVTDAAGDFSLYSDEIIENWQSHSVETSRVYYDPRPLTDPATCDEYTPTVDPWREPDAVSVRDKTIQAFQSGAGLITSNTHSNHFQWGSTDQTNNPKPFLLGFNDVLKLQNKEQLPVLFELTCYTAQFTRATASPNTGTVMDERFQRHGNGGAVAVFGPAGLTVAYGHDWLAAGAHEYLWEEVDTYQGKFGEMLEHAYMKLFTNGSCCQDARLTFLGLGDPLMPMLVNDIPETYLPITAKAQ